MELAIKDNYNAYLNANQVLDQTFNQENLFIANNDDYKLDFVHAENFGETVQPLSLGDISQLIVPSHFLEKNYNVKMPLLLPAFQTSAKLVETSEINLESEPRFQPSPLELSPPTSKRPRIVLNTTKTVQELMFKLVEHVKKKG